MLQEILILEKERNHSFYQVKITSYENEILALVQKISASDIKIASIEKSLLVEEDRF